MIENMILARLSEDGQLRDLLGSEPDNSRIKLLYTDLPTHTLVVSILPSSDDGVITRSQLQLRIIENDAEVLQQIADRVMRLLVMDEQQPPTSFIVDNKTVVLYRCTQNGGGQLTDDMDNIHTLIYFDLIWRCKNA